MPGRKKKSAPGGVSVGYCMCYVGPDGRSLAATPPEIRRLRDSLELVPLQKLSPVKTEVLRIAGAGIGDLLLEVLVAACDLGISPLDTSPGALHRLRRHAEHWHVPTDEVIAFYGWLHPVSPSGEIDRARYVHLFAPSPPGWAAHVPHPDENWSAFCTFLLFRARTSNALQQTPTLATFQSADLGIDIGDDRP